MILNFSVILWESSPNEGELTGKQGLLPVIIQVSYGQWTLCGSW